MLTVRTPGHIGQYGVSMSFEYDIRVPRVGIPDSNCLVVVNGRDTASIRAPHHGVGPLTTDQWLCGRIGIQIPELN